MVTAALSHEFRKSVLDYYTKYGRHELPWRTTTDPYAILVSELMLQQTQVARVEPKYKLFLETFPDVESLAKAPLSTVLQLWQGLGYNRRAKYLQETAKIIAASGGYFFRDRSRLMALPGIGTYTSGAILAFAYDVPVVMIETNIRTVFIHHFFADQDEVSDAEILELVAATLPKKDIRHWYYALMDYGSYLKKTRGGMNSRSRHYKKQAKFSGSSRQLRGIIIRLLSTGPKTVGELLPAQAFTEMEVQMQLEKLLREGLIVHEDSKYALPEYGQ